MNEQELHDEVLSLTLVMHQGEATKEECARLEYLLGNSEQAREQYAVIVYDTVTLSDETEAQRAQDAANFRDELQGHVEPAAGAAVSPIDPRPQATFGPQAPLSSSQPMPWRSSIGGGSIGVGWVVVGVAAIATVLAVSLPFGFWDVAENGRDGVSELAPSVDDSPVVDSAGGAAVASVETIRRDTVAFVARVIRQSSDAKWPSGSDPNEFLLRIKAGQKVELLSGLVELEFRSGAFIILHGPATLTPTGPASAHLTRGRVTGNVSDGDFRLLTPAAEVIDLGTKFGVAVDGQSNTEVCVFSGKVNVRSILSKDSPKPVLVTKGMAVRVDIHGKIDSTIQVDRNVFLRDIPVPSNVLPSPGLLSLVDIIAGGAGREARMAGAINPVTGKWDHRPFPFTKLAMAQNGPGSVRALEKLIRESSGRYQPSDASSVIDGVFIPSSLGRGTVMDSAGNTVDLPPGEGVTWGPIWARRDIDGLSLADDMEDFWGTDTLSGIRQRLAEASHGIVGIHPNVGITFDLRAMRMLEGRSFASFEAILANLDNSEIRNPDYAKTHRCSADFRVYVDGQLQYERVDFTRRDGDAKLIVPLFREDRFLTIVATDAGNTKKFDHLVLIDSVFRAEEFSD